METDGRTVIETRDGWMIQCRACQWHEFPKRPTAKGDSWTFNGDLVRPTFSPSMNESQNPPDHPGYNPDVKSSRCHFVVTNGEIDYCPDCSHELRGKMPLEPWPADKLAYYDGLKAGGAW